MSNICRGELPRSSCSYYVSWDAYVVLGSDWVNVYGGGYSVAGGSWWRLGEALVYPPSLEALGYRTWIYDYYRSFGAVKLNPRSGGGYTLYGLGGLWGAPEGKTQADPDEFPFFYIWSPEQGEATTTDIRFNFGGPQANTDYYINFGSRCGGLPNFSTTSCTPPKYLGTAAPPPPPPRKKMQCCTCNDIATIVENQSIVQLRAQEKLVENLKDHIDKRALEIIIKDLEHLKALDFEEFLKVILKRINQSEANLWNGAPR